MLFFFHITCDRLCVFCGVLKPRLLMQSTTCSAILTEQMATSGGRPIANVAPSSTNTTSFCGTPGFDEWKGSGYGFAFRCQLLDNLNFPLKDDVSDITRQRCSGRIPSDILAPTWTSRLSPVARLADDSASAAPPALDRCGGGHFYWQEVHLWRTDKSGTKRSAG